MQTATINAHFTSTTSCYFKRKIFLHTAGAIICCVQTRKMYLFRDFAFFFFFKMVALSSEKVFLPGSINEQFEPGLFSDFAVTKSSTTNEL